MEKFIEEGELQILSDIKLLELLRGKGVFFHLYNGKTNQGRVKDIIVTENNTSTVLFDTGQKTFRPTIKRIEIIDNCLDISL
jgi:hypothetical protein